MSDVQVGKEILSFCTKCKLTLGHTIASMKSDTNIGKVICNTCKSTHAYKDPSKVKSKATKSKDRTTKGNADSSISDIWMEAINKSKSKSQKYSPKEKFAKGDIIDHSKFGPGVIEKTIDQNKIEVIFRHDIKTLMHNLK